MSLWASTWWPDFDVSSWSSVFVLRASAANPCATVQSGGPGRLAPSRSRWQCNAVHVAPRDDWRPWRIHPGGAVFVDGGGWYMLALIAA